MKLIKPLGITISLVAVTSVLLGCSQDTSSTSMDIISSQSSTSELLDTFDITGDGAPEIISIVPSDITVAEDFTDVYPHVFTELTVDGGITSSATIEPPRKLLHITSRGIEVENGESIGAAVSTQVAYAASIQNDDTSELLLRIVQIDATGNPVSEPLQLNWDTQQSSWVIVP